MSLYKEESIANGNAYVRASRITMLNRLDGTKKIEFEEDKVFNIDGEIMSRKYRRMNSQTGLPSTLTSSLTAQNANVSFNIVDTSNISNVVGTMTYQEVYACMYSLYLHLANLSDSANIS
jgi:hypothetical protein